MLDGDAHGDAGPVTLAVERWGEGDRRVLLLHGLTSSGATWWRLADVLAANGYCVHAPDLRGHGRSPDADSYAVADYAGDLDPGPWELVVGHSLGGAIAVDAIASGAIEAQRLLLIDPVLVLTARERELLAATCIAEVSEGCALDCVRREHPGWDPLDAQLKAKAARSTSVEVVRGTLDGAAPWDFRPQAAELACPTVVLGGEPVHGALLAPAVGRELSAHNHGVRYRRVRGAGHSVHRDRPAAVTAAARSLLAG